MDAPQGGPFSEVGFLWKLREGRKQAIQTITRKLSALSVPSWIFSKDQRFLCFAVE